MKSQDLQYLPLEQELLTVLMEECSEVSIEASKIIRFGDSQNNLKNLEKEIGDLMCMVELLLENNMISIEKIEERSKIKREKLKIFSNIL